MATRFWVGGTGSWTAANTANWAATSGGAGGVSVPVDGDTVTFDGASGGGVVTVGAAYNPTMTSLTMGAFTGTLDFATNNGSPTMNTFDCSGTGTRTLNMGSGTWTIIGNNGTIFTIATSTNLTFNAGTSTINANYSGSTGTRTLNGSSTTIQMPNLNVTNGIDTISFSAFKAGNTNFTGFTGAWTSGIDITGSLTLGAGMTHVSGNATIFQATSGTQVITSNGVTFDSPITLQGDGSTVQLADNLTMGSVRTLTLTNGTFDANNFNVTCGAFSSSNSNVRTLTMGSGTWTLTGNNTTIFNISTAVNLTMTATTANVICNYSGSVGTRSLSSGNNNSSIVGPNFYITAGSDIFNFGNSSPRYQTLDFTGFTGTLQNGLSLTINLGSSLIFGSGMTNSLTSNITFNGTDSATTGTLTTNGIGLNSAINMTKVFFTLTLGSSLNTSSTLNVTNGTFNANNFDVTALSFDSSNANTRTVTMGTGTWTLTGSGTPWSTGTTTNLTLNSTGSSIVINDASSTDKTFAGGSKTYGNIRFTGAGTGVFIITGSNTFNAFTVDTPPHTIQFTAGTTTGFNTFNVNGSSLSNLMTITSVTAAQHTLQNNGNLPVIVTYCDISYSNAT